MKVAINGFGRIGRQICRQAFFSKKPVQIVAINDLSPIETNAHLLKYDSVHGIFAPDVEAMSDAIMIGDKKVKALRIPNASDLPWKSLNVDIVLECTGRFTTRELAEEHLKAGAKTVIVSAPCKKDDLTVVMGVNENQYNSKKHHILSNASCTTNCLGIVTKVLMERFGIKRASMTTIHSYTNDQRVLDLVHSDLRRARAAGLSMIPTTSGAQEAVVRIYPELKGVFEGYSVRVPTPNVSLVDLVCEVKKETSVSEVNQVFKQAASGNLKKYLGVNDKPLVSIDFLGDERSAILDALSTQVIGKDMVKVVAWYDNEVGFSARMLDLVEMIE